MEAANASPFLIWDIVKRVLHVFIQTEGVMKDLGLANPNPMVSIGEFIYEPLLSPCSQSEVEKGASGASAARVKISQLV